MSDDLDHRSPPAQRQPVTAGQLSWLENELRNWHAEGIVNDSQRDTIRGRYVAARRFSLARLLLMLGGAFLGVGLLWLVASNLDELSPLLRFVVVVTLWLLFTATAELFGSRRARGGPDVAASPLVGALRLIAALGFGAVVFQAAQSLQVPAYEPGLVGIWGLGALLYAYAAAAVMPLLVGIAAATGWYVWQVLEAAEDGMGFVLPVLLAAAVAGAVGAIHAGRRFGSTTTGFATTWRDASAVLVLLGVFVAAFPYVDLDGFTWSFTVLGGVAAAVSAVAAATTVSTGRTRVEALAPLAAVVAGVALVAWEPPAPVHGVVSAEGYLHAFVSVAVYVAVAGWYAVLGVLADATRLTVAATVALVLFTTVQSFAVFAPIITGATLFLALGAVLLGSGYAFDRGRRRLVANLEGATA